MARTTEALMEEIIEIRDDVTVDAYIRTASFLVDRACVDSEPYEYTDEDLQLIETWLAAHFYAIFDPRTTDEKVSTVQEKYQSKVDLGLDVTHYGQQCKILDVNGGLAALDAASKKKFAAQPAGGHRPVLARFLGRRLTNDADS